MNLRNLLLAFAFIQCVACADMRANMNIRNHADGLSTTLDEYGADLRWGRYRQAYTYHIHHDGTQPQFNLEQLENYSVTSFRPANPVLNSDATEAVIPVEIEYYNEQYGMVRKFKDTQKWWFNGKEEKWFTEADFPVFK